MRTIEPRPVEPHPLERGPLEPGPLQHSADQLTVRRTNLGLVLRRLREGGPRSRATLAAELGLTRSAVSTLVTELAERGLVRIGGTERGGVGRPGTTVELDGHGICGLGAEVNVNHV